MTMIGRQLLHQQQRRAFCSSRSTWMQAHHPWSRQRPVSDVLNEVACSNSISNTAIQVNPQQQQMQMQQLRWLATKRQQRTAAVATPAPDDNASKNGESTKHPNSDGGDSTGASDSATTAALSDLPSRTKGDTRGDDDDDKTNSIDDTYGRIFQSHDQIFVQRPDAATGGAAAVAPQPSPTLWLPPPLSNTKDLQEAFQQQQQDASTSTSLFEFQDHYRQMYNPDVHLASAPTDWTGYEAATPLWHDLAALIGVSGRPISVADYMRLCLTHPVHGYYTRANNSSSSGTAGGGGRSSEGTTSADGQLDDDFDHDEWDADKDRSNDDDGLIIGPSGDFVTAPEMSQIFGECLAVWFMTVWQQKQQHMQQSIAALGANDSSDSASRDITAAGATSAWQWLEFGPGTGTLMADLIRFCFYGSDKIRNTFGGSNCQAIHFIEQSPRLRKVQKKTLENVHDHAIVGPGEEKAKRWVEFVFHNDGEKSSSIKKDEAAVLKASENGIAHRLPVYWHDSLAHFHAWQEKNQSYLPTHVVCQEFLDALPIYAFEKTAKEGWRERLVDIALREDMMASIMDDESSVQDNSKEQEQQPSHDVKATAARIGTMKKPRLRIVLAPEVTPAARTLLGVKGRKKGKDDIIELLPNEDPPAPVGSVIEVNPEAILLVQDLARLIDRQGGAAIIIDYGPEHGSRDSIRAFSRHEQVHWLSQPGLVDITADVDFAALKHAVNHSHDSSTSDSDVIDKKSATRCATRAFGPVPQGNFLMAMGANDRAVQLIESDNTTEEDAENVYEALVRLCSPEDMGQRFKVMALLDPSTCGDNNSSSFQQPPGF